ncbi:tRNA dihydrouridine synthase DusB [Anatilimnocola sp. NA78]|uniref:tRNA dihydrouridine synthase DusB n=1 Tax=Anatilimnocola sp. NA78 TaxID=3415683 RepID=UPI003CE54FFB
MTTPATLTNSAAPTASDALPLPQVKPLFIGNVQVDPPILQAPMAGFTNYAYRQIVRKFGGSGLLATEMVSARSFVWMEDHAAEHPERLWGVKDEPRPLAVQMWDNDPETLARVGHRLANEFQVSVVDLNFGCPVRDLTERAHSGSYLLKFPERVGAIIERVVEACAPTPVTAKIRLGCSHASINACEIARVVEAAGAAALTVHGRVASDFFRGSADWEKISEIKQHLKRIPLIGNGDLDSPQKVVEAFRRYNVDGVMIARASLGRPWLFQQCAAALRGDPIPPEPSLDEQRDWMLRHYELVCERFGEERGTLLMRKFACNYAQGKAGTRHFRGAVGHVNSRFEFLAAVAQHFPRQDNPADYQPADAAESCEESCG